MIRIAIHHREGSFSDRWITYCEEKQVPYKIVNCYDSDIVRQMDDCDALMWHHHHDNYKDLLFAKQLLFAIEQTGKKVFPDFNTGWHFDNKVGQKYLFELIKAPLIPSYVFYSREEALEWVNRTTFPKVFKLRSGAGSGNVRLIKTVNDAKRIINKAFNRGFPKRGVNIKERIWRYKTGKGTLLEILKGIVRTFIPSPTTRMLPREKGYVYFQDFIPNNTFDIRIIVIGSKAFAIKRLIRENDFRASGSGRVVYNKDEMPEQCIRTSFDLTQKMQLQCVGYDFIFDENNQPLIAEISYGFTTQLYDPCPGYWDIDLKWHEGKINPQEWMIENLINSIKQ